MNNTSSQPVFAKPSIPAPSEAYGISQGKAAKSAFIDEIARSAELREFWSRYIAIGIKAAAVRSQYSAEISLWLSEANRYHPREGWFLAVPGLRTKVVSLPQIDDLLALPTSMHDTVVIDSFVDMGEILSEMGYQVEYETSEQKHATLKICWDIVEKE